jgi:hypothetical protein
MQQVATTQTAAFSQEPCTAGAIYKAIDEYKRYAVPAVLVAVLSERYGDLIYNRQHNTVIELEAVRHRTLAIKEHNILAHARPLSFIILWTELYCSVHRELEIAALENVIARKQYAAEQTLLDYLAAMAAWDTVIYTSPMSFESKQCWVDYSVTAKADEHLWLQKDVLEDKQRLRS